MLLTVYSTNIEAGFIYSELVRSHRSLSKSLRELERNVRSEVHLAVDRDQTRTGLHSHRRRSGAEYEFDVEGVKRAQKVQKVKLQSDISVMIMTPVVNLRRDKPQILSVHCIKYFYTIASSTEYTKIKCLDL